MKFFIDTANIGEIRELSETGMIDGVTTNPSLIAKTGENMTEVISEICSVIDGPVSAEVAATESDQMIKEGQHLAQIANNVVIKVPLTVDGLNACHFLSKNGIMVNVTLCFSESQAILAAKAGATYISPFVGRLDDISLDGMNLIANIRQIYENYAEFDTQILTASVRSPKHVVDAALVGADVVTIPPTTLRQLYNHPLTDKGLESFLKDWAKTGQSII